MTISELYDWAIENNAEECELIIVEGANDFGIEEEDLSINIEIDAVLAIM